jgi:hypothetical protein
MAKKIYSTPLMEVEQVNLSSCLLDGSPIVPPVPVPPHPGAPQRHRTPVF